MTREEQIKQESKKRHLEKYNQDGFCPDFEKGAEWADEHPSMEQKQQFVDKTWQWIFRIFVITAPLDFQQAIEKEFRKEMNGE